MNVEGPGGGGRSPVLPKFSPPAGNPLHAIGAAPLQINAHAMVLGAPPPA